MLVWKVKNPNPSATNQLQLIKTQGALIETHTYTWDALNDMWTLTQGGANGTRTETEVTSYPTAFSRTVTNIVKDGSGATAAKTTRVYLTYPFGEKLAKLIRDPDGAALTTVYTYYENATEAHKYGKMSSLTNADGSWEKYDYDVNNKLSQVLRSWKDIAMAAADLTNCRATLYVYEHDNTGPVPQPLPTPPAPQTVSPPFRQFLLSESELVEGKMVRHTSYTAVRWNGLNEIQLNGKPIVTETRTEYNLSVPSTGPVTLPGMTTTTVSYTTKAAAPFTGRVAYINYPDGRRDTYNYEKGDWTPNVTDPGASTFIPNATGLELRETVTQGTTASPTGVINKTTQEHTIRDRYGRTVMTKTHIYTTGATYWPIAWTARFYDTRGNLTETRRHNGQQTTAVWVGDLKMSEINENGEETTYTYDSLMRVKTQTKKGVAANPPYALQADIVTTFNYDAEGRAISQAVASGGLSLTNSTAYDVAGRVVRSTDQTGLITATEYTNGGRTTTVRAPGGGTQVTDNFLDGQIKSLSGTAVVTQTYDYGREDSGVTLVGSYSAALPWTIVYTGANGVTSPRWTKTLLDWQGHTVRTETPSFTGTNRKQWFTYNAQGQLVRQETLAGTTRLQRDKLFEYDALGNQTRSGSDNDDSGTLTPASLDQITDTEMLFENMGSDWFKTTMVKNYLTDNNATPTTMQTQKERLNNFPAGVGNEKTFSESLSLDVNGNQTKVSTLVDRAAKKVRNLSDIADSTLDAETISVNGLTQSSKPATPRTATTYAYDALGRQLTMTDPATGVTTNVYDAATGRLTSTTGGGQTTSYSYYANNHASAGQMFSQVNTANKKVYFEYSLRGELVRTWGDTTYPLESVYNDYGEKTELRTYRGGLGWAGTKWPGTLVGTADVTMWITSVRLNKLSEL
ncbi:MAG: RHS repeat protein [Acidobacteria bacterium]|nr:RHS repeat protein [Acidobacteriota bacterium]